MIDSSTSVQWWEEFNNDLTIQDVLGELPWDMKEYIEDIINYGEQNEY